MDVPLSGNDLAAARTGRHFAAPDRSVAQIRR
jgi:hypothetical protein